MAAEYTLIPKKKGKQVIRGRLEDYKIREMSAEELMEKFKIKPENPDKPTLATEEVYIYFTESFYVK